MPAILRAWLGTPRIWLDFRRKRFWVVALFLIYTLAGYFVVPPILRHEIVVSAQKTLERPVTLDDLLIDPFALSIDLRGFHIDEPDGSLLIGFDRLYIRFSLASLVHWAWSFDDIRLDGVKGNIIRYSETDTNIGRLISAAGKSSDGTKPETDHGLMRLVVNRLKILNATATFTDHARANPFQTLIGPVTVEIGRFSTLPQRTGEQHILVEMEGGATLEWTSEFGLNPLISAGHVSAKGPYPALLTRYFGDAIKISAPTGSVDAGLDYRLRERPDGVLALTVEHVGLAISDLALHEQGAAAPFLTLPELRLAGGHLAWPEKKAGADALAISGATLALRRQEDGQLGPAPWLAAPQPAVAPAPQPTTATAPPGMDWAVSLGKVEVKNAKARFEDQAIGEPGKIEISSFDLAVDSLSNTSGAEFPFSLAAGMETGGLIKMQGRFSILPDLRLDAKLTASDLRIAAAQAYLHDMARLTIDDGRFDGETDVKLREGGLSVAGHGEIRGVKLRDEVENTPVLSWDRLGVDRYEFRQATNELQISQVTIGGSYLRFRVAEDQSTNFDHIMVGRNKSSPDARQAGRAGRAKPTVPGEAAGAAPPLKVSVGKIVIAKGTADYGDASLPLPFAAHISDLQGEVATLASASSSPARVTLRGQVGEFGQVKIDGSLTPFNPGKSTKINVLFRNVEFPGLSPYTVKFAGRRIAKGRLDVDLQYSIDEGKLNGANRVVIRDMELGEKLDVPGAMDLPLELAIALLKDQDGKIDVDLPVSGNLNDPQFDIGSVISKATFNLLTNLITSPFRALAGLLGGGDDALDHIDFAPGRAVLDPPEKEKILHLARALEMRPHLGLVVPGVVDPDVDRIQLQLDALDARMARELGDRNTVKRQRQLLEQLFEERIGKEQLESLTQPAPHSREGTGDSGAALDEPTYVAALRGRVATTEPIGEAGLASLAQARAEAVVGALKLIPGFDPQRVSLRGSTTAQAGDDGAIPLKLDAASTSGGD
ncbi:DUF748 domain-containing protein [Telmatospirillum siberiense]|uniref:DUF748 domain-containing protein n=1 Tax=Telmatospirillum siberiense TaxID=382514 RepID=UPI00130442FE|nr:DUF748 domain-containing protein [Telmatospirillum siberiense]